MVYIVYLYCILLFYIFCIFIFYIFCIVFSIKDDYQSNFIQTSGIYCVLKWFWFIVNLHYRLFLIVLICFIEPVLEYYLLFKEIVKVATLSAIRSTLQIFFLFCNFTLFACSCFLFFYLFFFPASANQFFVLCAKSVIKFLCLKQLCVIIKLLISTG